MLVSIASLQLGQAFGKSLFAVVPSAGVATLRLSFAAVILRVIHHDPVRREPRTWVLSVGLGVAIAGMNLIYPALDRGPVALAVTLQFLGPLSVALLGSRRIVDLFWGLLAGGGIALFLNPVSGEPPTAAGLGLALASGSSWAIYLLLSRRLGARTVGGRALVPAVTLAALLTAPFGIAMAGTALLRPSTLAAGLGVAVLTAALPYSLDLVVLRRLPPRIVGVLASFEPLLGGLAASLVLGELLTLVQWLAVGCVVVSSIGAVTADQGTRPATRPHRTRQATALPASDDRP